MNTEKLPNHCPKCGAHLPSDAPEGLCAKCLLLSAATPTEAGQPQPTMPVPAPDVLAKAFPQFEIVELIGQGGMGMVYKARQPKLDRLVALKILPQALAADPAFAERFNREARVLARLNHPNIVTVHDFGQSGGFFYLLMEFVDGVNLRQAMRAGRFSPQQALYLVPKICDALQFAHDEGVLHRDIKPENILLDARGRVKIADFGIAKLLGEARQANLTGSGLAVGTPHYMAPEQLEHPQDVDQRADIYSLGVVFYEMLTGELPIGHFAAPSAKCEIDRRVDAVVLQALEKEREKRYRRAGDVKTSVEAIAGPESRANSGAPAPAPTPASEPNPTLCFFSTPKRMRNCFPGPQAHIYQCRGELHLETDSLCFISPWRQRVSIRFPSIQDLSVGQFQLWTTPWIMKYERINFLSVTYAESGREQTVLLTPVPGAARSLNPINDEVARWFEAVRDAVVASTGTAPHVSEPREVTVRAQKAWNRKGLPLFAAVLLTWLALVYHLEPLRHHPNLTSMLLLGIHLLLLGALLLYCVGFLRAKYALSRGNLDAVTSDEPPEVAARELSAEASAR